MAGREGEGERGSWEGRGKTQKEGGFSARKWGIWAILSPSAAACFFPKSERQRILEPASKTTYEDFFFSSDLAQSIKTAIFHHGAEQPTESHIERTDPCMEKAQLGTRTRLGRGSKSRLIPPRSRPCVSRL